MKIEGRPRDIAALVTELGKHTGRREAWDDGSRCIETGEVHFDADGALKAIARAEYDAYSRLRDMQAVIDADADEELIRVVHALSSAAKEALDTVQCFLEMQGVTVDKPQFADKVTFHDIGEPKTMI